jgi:deoxycytidylate deaminase
MNKSELAIGIVTPLGINHDDIASTIQDYFSHYGYHLEDYRLSKIISENYKDRLPTNIVVEPEHERISSHIAVCNEFRSLVKKGDAVVLAAIHSIYEKRQSQGGGKLENTVHLFRTLKHPDEVRTLRDIYGKGFYLLGFTAAHEIRVAYLRDQKGIKDPQKLQDLMKRDALEIDPLGQHTSSVFHLSDCFFSVDEPTAWKKKFERFLHLIFANPLVKPPYKDEYAMFLAFAASLRSGDLSRQVGAVITSDRSDIIATGVNDAPKSLGGQYWSDDEDNDHRDISKKRDENDAIKQQMMLELLTKMNALSQSSKEQSELVRETLEGSMLNDITEFGRAVHAEMEALLACARSGVSPVGGTLYCTTFPCHNCAKHIIDAGIKRVVYVEPYPKSKAYDLHKDALHLGSADKHNDNKVVFEPFVGVGPWRFVDLFTMKHPEAKELKRKDKSTGRKVSGWNTEEAVPRFGLSEENYIAREKRFLSYITQALESAASPKTQI